MKLMLDWGARAADLNVLHALRLTPSGLVEKELRYTCKDQHTPCEVGMQPLNIVLQRQAPTGGCSAVPGATSWLPPPPHNNNNVQVLCMPRCASSLSTCHLDPPHLPSNLVCNITHLLSLPRAGAGSQRSFEQVPLAAVVAAGVH